MNEELKNILSRVDHTLLAQAATWNEIKAICDDGVKYGCASVCIPASYVKQAADYVAGKIAVCTVIGFPNGYDTTASKCFQATDAVNNGASEIDMVINIGMLKDGRDDEVLAEINAIKAACAGHTLKVIIETCLLSEDEKIRMCDIVSKSDADFIKTSTGKEGVNATLEVSLVMVRAIRDYLALTGYAVGYKPAGGISSARSALQYLTLMKEELGDAWLQPTLFRFGASSLLTDIERQIEHFVTGRYSAAHRHAMP